jgi:hypothetical protein
MFKPAALTAMVLAACTASPIDVHGAFDNVESLRTFHAADGFFDVGTHYDVFTSNGVMLTELHFMSDPNACSWWTNSNASTKLKWPLLEIDTALYTGSPTAQTTGVVDLSVHAPGTFSLSPAASSDDQADAGWLVEGSDSGYDGFFTTGAIQIDEASDARLVGSIELQGSGGQAITGSFSLAHCVDADWAH